MTGRMEYIKTVSLRRDPHFPDRCVACGRCEKHCPQHLPIIESLKTAHRALRPFYIRAADGVARAWTYRRAGDHAHD